MNTFKVRLLSIFVLVCLLATVPNSYARAYSVIYVDRDATGLNNGTSWKNAYTDLQSALAVEPPAVEIWVAEGVYKPTTGTDRRISFDLETGVAIYGGFAGDETTLDQRDPVKSVTILSGEIGYQGGRDNSYHVVTSNGVKSSAILDGFTITAGNANRSYNASDPDAYGGGMYNLDSAPTLRNLIFEANGAYSGGGMSNTASYPTLTNITFNDNVAHVSGGGMAIYAGSNVLLTDVTFSGNSAKLGLGGGMFIFESSATLTDVTFTDNSAGTGLGGGIYNDDTGSLTLLHVTFDGNTADWGGGMWTDENVNLTNVVFNKNSATESGGGLHNTSDSVLENVTFSNNTASRGGGMSSTGNPTLTNVTFSGNSAEGGGGMLISPNSSPTLTNVTFSENSATGEGGGLRSDGTPILYNAILWGNTAPEGAQVYDNGSPCNPVTIYNSVVQDDCPKGSICTDIITKDPLLGTLGDYGGLTQTMPLLPGSSAIDTGDDAVCPTTDQRGVPRPQGSRCDIGAYEATLIIDDTDPAWSYSGSWTAWTGAGPYNNTMHYTSTLGDQVALTFQGTRFVLTLQRNTNRGQIEVYVDNVLVDTINANGPVLWQWTWTSPVFSAGVHSLRFRFAGGGTYMDIDAITIFP
jgi:predicted outer membrane repeat protein